MNNLRSLPKLRDSISFLYFEHAKIEKDQNAIKVLDAQGVTQVPVSSVSSLLLGPGTTITHDAVRIIVENGCSLIWTGEEGVRTYAFGTGETKKSGRLMKQVQMWADLETRLRVVVNMYKFRFTEPLQNGLSLQQIRGKEGIRVREAYAKFSKEYGVEWKGRSYDRTGWQNSEPINRALSTANSCLYGLVHAAIVSTGYSPALGFIHTGKQLSFVYDIADMYKVENSIPIAFQAVSASAPNLEQTVRRAMRDRFKETKLIQNIVTDIDKILEVEESIESEYDNDPAKPSGYWDPPPETEAKILCL